MLKKITALFLLFFLLHDTHAQLLRWSPTFIQETDQDISITCNSSFGNKGLLSYISTTDVYVHIGAITNLSTSSSNWKHVPFQWATTNTLANANSPTLNEWKYTIAGGLRSFFNITDPNEKIQKIAILFRSGDGKTVQRNNDGSDMYIPVYDNGLYARIDAPISNPTYVPSLVAIKKLIGDDFSLTANASQASTISVSYNGNIIQTTTGTTITTTTPILTAGPQKFIIEAQAGGNIAKDSISFFVSGGTIIAPLPTGIVDGINYEQGDTSVVLALYAPGKSSISVIGDFNNWTETDQGQMNKTPDGNWFWTRITGLTDKTEYAYQFIIDGSIKVADYNTEKVLDPDNDKFIPSNTYPNLTAYPTGKTSGIVSILQTGKPSYTWKTTNFNRPDKKNLVIYELLIRDFLGARNFTTLKDTISYLKKLGVNAIEVMPFSEFEGNISWGYNPNYFFAPDKFYGTENAIKDFIDACHHEGIAVIMDVVLNHCFNSSPFAQMYWDGTNNRPAADNPWLNPIATHPFSVGNDFNHEAFGTKQLTNRVMKHWMTNYKIDGFRWDLSKGFTQTNNPTDVGAWGNYDASRIAIWKRIYDTLQSISPNSYCILEHFADNNEERELAAYGMLLWGNGNYNFAQATMGYTDDDFSGISAKKRGWTNNHLIGYMESHDEERLMYKNITSGNTVGTYNIKDPSTALKRNAMAAAFWSMLPGPKMMWQFEELGFPNSINTCADGSVNNNCRLDNKNPVWNFYQDPFKRGLFDVFSNLIRLRMKKNYFTTFTTTNYTYNFSTRVKTLSINDDSLKVVIVGNFDLTDASQAITFPADGVWYSYLTGTSLNVSGGTTTINLKPGEYHVYLNKDLSANLVTAIISPTIQPLNSGIKIYPNPVRTTARINYKLATAGKTQIDIIDLNGITISTILNSVQSAGNHTLLINEHALNQINKHNGMLLLKITNTGKQDISRFMLIK